MSISAFDCECVSGNTGKHLRTGKRTLSSSDCHGVRHMVFRMQRDMPECAGAGISTLESVKRDWLSLGLYLWKTTTPKGGLLVKLIEPPCTERYARWCERSVGEIIAYLLLDLAWKQKSFIFLGILAIFFWRDSKRSGKGFDKMCIISET